jgi:hypothetical protein
VPIRTMDGIDDSNGLTSARADDCAWLVGLLATMADADMDTTAETLEGLARRLRKASKARRLLTRASPASIRAAFDQREKRNQGTPCR